MDDSTIFLCGDVMTGRGIDQVLAHPGEPELHEPYAHSALDYVELAERRNGEISAPVGFDYVWGDALAELDHVAPGARIVNLETSVTSSGAWEPKGINYRMHPDNVPCLVAAGIDCCVLANNHVLDWGVGGLDETLDTLHAVGLATAGAGRGREAAARPGVVDAAGARVLVYGLAGPDCGVPPSWAARDGELGVAYLPDYSPTTADEVAALIGRHRRTGDLVIASIHWGSNWGYAVPGAHRRFARRLIDSGTIDVIHGHSSHHPRGIEVYDGRAILYGCGDFLNDYEGISGHEGFRGDLALMYFLTSGEEGLARLRMVPLRMVRFRLERASAEEAAWLQETLDRASDPFGTHIRLGGDMSLEAVWS